MIYIETPRMILRDWTEDDFIQLVKLNSDENVMKYFPKTLSEAESRDMLNQLKNEFNEYGYGVYVLEQKSDHSFIGFTGFHNVPAEMDFAPAVEIMWRLRFDKWGKGYATEAALACLDYAKEKLNFTDVYAFTTVWNKISEHVMQKIGMSKVKEFNHPLLPANDLLSPHVLYKISLK